MKKQKATKHFIHCLGCGGIGGGRGMEIKHDYKNLKLLKLVVEIFSHIERVSQGAGKPIVLWRQNNTTHCSKNT